MAISKKHVTPQEARKLCPICNKYDKIYQKGHTGSPICLYKPELISAEEKHQCLFSKYAGYKVVQAHCDLCGRELPDSRVIEGVHPLPEPTIDDMYVCNACLNLPENTDLKRRVQELRRYQQR